MNEELNRIEKSILDCTRMIDEKTNAYITGEIKRIVLGQTELGVMMTYLNNALANLDLIKEGINSDD